MGGIFLGNSLLTHSTIENIIQDNDFYIKANGDSVNWTDKEFCTLNISEPANFTLNDILVAKEEYRDIILQINNLDTNNTKITNYLVLDVFDPNNLTNHFSNGFFEAKIDNSNTIQIWKNQEVAIDLINGEGEYAVKMLEATEASGISSFATGIMTTASGNYSCAEGNTTIASGNSAHSEGQNTTASAQASHSEGDATIASGIASHAEGSSTTASGESAHAEGVYSKAQGNYSHAEGHYTVASGESAHAEGFKTVAKGKHSHAEGYKTKAAAERAHSEGGYTLASGRYSHTEGGGFIYDYLNVSGVAGSLTYTIEAAVDFDLTDCYLLNGQEYGRIVDYDSSALTITLDKTINADLDLTNVEVDIVAYTESAGERSHAEGKNAIAFGEVSHAEGVKTRAYGNYSHAEGQSTTASGENQHVQGRNNISDTTFAHIVGNGTSASKRSNAHTLDWSGNAWFSGDVYVGSTSGTNKDEGSLKLATVADIEAAIGAAIGGSY